MTYELFHADNLEFGYFVVGRRVQHMLVTKSLNNLLYKFAVNSAVYFVGKDTHAFHQMHRFWENCQAVVWTYLSSKVSSCTRFLPVMCWPNRCSHNHGCPNIARLFSFM